MNATIVNETCEPLDVSCRLVSNENDYSNTVFLDKSGMHMDRFFHVSNAQYGALYRTTITAEDCPATSFTYALTNDTLALTIVSYNVEDGKICCRNLMDISLNKQDEYLPPALTLFDGIYRKRVSPEEDQEWVFWELSTLYEEQFGGISIYHAAVMTPEPIPDTVLYKHDSERACISFTYQSTKGDCLVGTVTATSNVGTQPVIFSSAVVASGRQIRKLMDRLSHSIIIERDSNGDIISQRVPGYEKKMV